MGPLTIPLKKTGKLGQTSHLRCFFLLLCFGLWLCFGLPLWAFQRHPSNEASLAVVVARVGPKLHWAQLPGQFYEFHDNFMYSHGFSILFPDDLPGGAVVVVLIPHESYPLVTNRQAKTTSQWNCKPNQSGQKRSIDAPLFHTSPVSCQGAVW